MKIENRTAVCSTDFFYDSEFYNFHFFSVSGFGPQKKKRKNTEKEKTEKKKKDEDYLRIVRKE